MRHLCKPLVWQRLTFHWNVFERLVKKKDKCKNKTVEILEMYFSSGQDTAHRHLFLKICQDNFSDWQNSKTQVRLKILYPMAVGLLALMEMFRFI